jgi:uncharacterized delta-60 repeat protein
MYGAMNTNYKSLILTVSLFFALSTTITAAPGDLDLSFGSGGIVLTSFAPDQYWYDSARTVRVQPDGKIVVGGWISDTDNNGDHGFFLARYHPTGALDASFGTNGKITGPINSGEMVGNDIALQPDGKIIAVGYGFFSSWFAVHRYNANGTLDASFGAGGVVLTPINGSGGASSVAIQADGKIVVAGYVSSPGQSYSDFAVVRLLPDGSLDTSFGGTGKVITSVGNNYSYAGKVLLQPDGKIVAVGSAFVGNNQGLALVRYNSDGSLDSGFGSSGKIIHGVFNPSIFWFGDAVLQPDGKIIASGHFSAGGPGWDTIFRINPNGSRDPSFAFLSAENLYIGNGIALQTDGKPVFFGYENSGGNYRFAILRLNPNGTPDTGFGTNGRVFTQIGSGGSAADGALQPDGKILALGVTSVGFTDNDIAIVRYLGDSTPTCSNPIDCADFFVRQHYLDFLNREPDPLSAQWVSLINSCPPGDTTCDRVHVSSAFFQSPEFQQRGYFLYRFYPVALGRKPDYNEFTPDLGKVSGFLTDAQLETAKLNFIAEFMSRPAFVTKFNGLDNAAYVDSLLTTAAITHPSRDLWIAALAGGTRTRAQVLREIVESTEVYSRYYNQAFVVMQYFGYLRRDPDILYINWIAHLEATGDYRSMIQGFVNSVEYRGRFGP